MKNHIKKIIFSDDSEVLLGPIIPFQIIENENPWDRNKRKRAYEYQFRSFQENILSNLIQDFVKSYSESEFELISEDDCDCSDKRSDIEDFSDDEITKAAIFRNIIFSPKPLNIITVDFQNRFYRIMNTESSILLDSLLTDLEKKLKI